MITFKYTAQALIAAIQPRLESLKNVLTRLKDCPPPKQVDGLSLVWLYHREEIWNTQSAINRLEDFSKEFNKHPLDREYDVTLDELRFLGVK